MVPNCAQHNNTSPKQKCIRKLKKKKQKNKKKIVNKYPRAAWTKSAYAVVWLGMHVLIV